MVPIYVQILLLKQKIEGNRAKEICLLSLPRALPCLYIPPMFPGYQGKRGQPYKPDREWSLLPTIHCVVQSILLKENS